MANTGASPRGRSGDPRRLIKPLTTSLSGIPIGGASQGGGLYDFSAMRQARWSEFYNTQHSHKNMGYDFAIKNKFAPNDAGRRTGFIGGGYTSIRRESSSSKVVQEPLDHFKSHRAFVHLKGAGVTPRIRFMDTSRMRSRAKNIYNKANPQNLNDLDIQRRMDYSEIKQLRIGNNGIGLRGKNFGE
jgi:hypothetical protein